jgi:hypothetical protein
MTGTPRSDWNETDPNADSAVSDRAASVSYTESSAIVPLGDPHGALHQLDKKLKSKQWNVQFEALNLTRALALHHAAVLNPHLHAVTAAVVLAADSLRSSVAKNGLITLNDMCTGLQQRLSKETGVIGNVLVKRGADTSNKFVSNAANDALRSLVTYCAGPELLKTLVVLSSSKNAAQREKAALSINSYVQTHGCESMEERELNDIVKCSARFTTDGKQGSRRAGRELVWALHQENALQPQILKRMSSSEQAAIAKITSKGVSGEEYIHSPAPTREMSPQRASVSGRNRTNRSRQTSPRLSREQVAGGVNRKTRPNRVMQQQQRQETNDNRVDGGEHNNVGWAQEKPRKSMKPARSAQLSHETIQQKRVMRELTLETERQAQEDAKALQKQEHRKKTAELAERGRAKAYERLQQQKLAAEAERKRAFVEEQQRLREEAALQTKRDALNEDHRKRTQRRLAEHKAKQRQVAETESSRRARVEEAAMRVKAERAAQHKARMSEERDRIRQRGANAVRTKAVVVERNQLRMNQRETRQPVKQSTGQSSGPLKQSSPVGYPSANEAWEKDALKQVQKSRNERLAAQTARQGAFGDADLFGATNKAVKNYAWQDDEDAMFGLGAGTEAGEKDSAFEADLNGILEYHPPIPKRGATALNEELSALGLDGLQDDMFFAKPNPAQKAMGSRGGKEKDSKRRRQPRKLMELNEVGSYEYGAHGALVPEGTVASMQQDPLSPLSRFIRHSDSREFAAYQRVKANEIDYPNMSPAPITKSQQYVNHKVSSGNERMGLNTMNTAERQLIQELAGLDHKLENNRRKNLKSTRSEPTRRTRPRQVQRPVPVATASMARRPQPGITASTGVQYVPQGAQMLSQSPGGRWQQQQSTQYPANAGAAQLHRAYGNNHFQAGNAAHQYAMAGYQPTTVAGGMNMASSHYGYVPSYGNGPTQPVYHEGIAYYYPQGQIGSQPNVFGQAASRNLNQQQHGFHVAAAHQYASGAQTQLSTNGAGQHLAGGGMSY